MRRKISDTAIQFICMTSIFILVVVILTCCLLPQRRRIAKNIFFGSAPCLDSMILSSSFANYLKCERIKILIDSSFISMDTTSFKYKYINKSYEISIRYISGPRASDSLLNLGLTAVLDDKHDDVILLSKSKSNDSIIVDLNNTHKIIEKIYFVSDDCDNELLILQINAPGAFGSFMRYREIIAIDLNKFVKIHQFAFTCDKW